MSGPKRQKDARRPRTLAEWVTLGLSLCVLAVVAGVLVYDGLRGSRLPPRFEVQPLPAEAREHAGLVYLPVEVRNTGERTAADIRVRVEPGGGGGAGPWAEFEVRFLAGGESSRAVVVLPGPAQGATARIVSFAMP